MILHKHGKENVMVKINKIWSDYNSMEDLYSIRTDVFEEDYCTICYVKTPFDILKFMTLTGIERCGLSMLILFCIRG